MPIGMGYEDVRTRVKRINSMKQADPQKKSALINSLLNQTTQRDGAGARRELERELRSK